MRSKAKQAALSNGRPKSNRTGGGGCSSDEDEEDNSHSGPPGPYTTDDDIHDRVLNIISWEVALGVGIKDELSSSSVSGFFQN